MTRMTLAERRQKLIAAALAVVARNGVAAATTRAIAAEAGVSEPEEAAEATVTVLEGLTQSLVTTGDEAAARRAIDYWSGMRAAC